MMKKLYFVQTNADHMLVSDDGDVRRVLNDNNDVLLCDVEDPEAFLVDEVEDDSSWEIFENPIEDFTEFADNEVIAVVEKDL